jgi:hypothetical protein
MRLISDDEIREGVTADEFAALVGGEGVVVVNSDGYTTLRGRSWKGLISRSMRVTLS